ncbi:MAG: hypothetical protein CH6_3415 [Candidatus Kapaibacterium sp.]|jgi:Skp family chaperone for outer membrane proteins|nr:MAG: hypothetical protein CH6_3415 [Candidatus Kapabacteria bacterium]ROL56536.1 MAG: OmpH family outer membrane protein [Bacteroidetes/Chlorobi group bacterium Naka2016]
MKNTRFLFIIILLAPIQLFAQRVGFIASDIIREKFPEAKQAEQRIRSVVEEWKRELEDMDKRIENLKFEINKNRLIWTEEEKRNKEKELEDLTTQKLTYSRKKFEPGGEYDILVKTIMQPVEEKIYAAVQKVAAENGFDIIWDKSTNPLAYVNYKYDLTLKVLRELGVDVSQMEKELQEKISKDPRNQVKVETPSTQRKKQRTTKKEVQTEKPEEKPIQENPDNKEEEQKK